MLVRAVRCQSRSSEVGIGADRLRLMHTPGLTLHTRVQFLDERNRLCPWDSDRYMCNHNFQYTCPRWLMASSSRAWESLNLHNSIPPYLLLATDGTSHRRYLFFRRPHGLTSA